MSLLQDIKADPDNLARAARVAQITWELVQKHLPKAHLEAKLSSTVQYERVFHGFLFSRILEIWKQLFSRTWVPKSNLTQASMLVSTTRTSSSCTGIFTAEMALAVVEKTVNESQALSQPVSYRPVCVYVAWRICFQELHFVPSLCLLCPYQALIKSKPACKQPDFQTFVFPSLKLEKAVIVNTL